MKKLALIVLLIWYVAGNVLFAFFMLHAHQGDALIWLAIGDFLLVSYVTTSIHQWKEALGDEYEKMSQDEKLDIIIRVFLWMTYKKDSLQEKHYEPTKKLVQISLHNRSRFEAISFVLFILFCFYFLGAMIDINDL